MLYKEHQPPPNPRRDMEGQNNKNVLLAAMLTIFLIGGIAFSLLSGVIHSGLSHIWSGIPIELSMLISFVGGGGLFVLVAMRIFTKKTKPETPGQKAAKEEMRTAIVGMESSPPIMGPDTYQEHTFNVQRVLLAQRRLADEFDPGWTKRGYCNLSKIRELREFEGYLGELFTPRDDGFVNYD